MHAIRKRLAWPVSAAETVGWRGDAIEAEAFAYLAARTFTGLPISYPGHYRRRRADGGGADRATLAALVILQGAVDRLTRTSAMRG